MVLEWPNDKLLIWRQGTTIGLNTTNTANDVRAWPRIVKGTIYSRQIRGNRHSFNWTALHRFKRCCSCFASGDVTHDANLGICFHGSLFEVMFCLLIYFRLFVVIKITNYRTVCHQLASWTLFLPFQPATIDVPANKIEFLYCILFNIYLSLLCRPF